MKSITLELTYPSGAVYRLRQPISVSIVRSLESPAQSLSASFPIIKGLLPDIGVGARLLRGGAEIFSGFCDQQVTREDEKGRTFTIQARSRGGLLLDNEALPRTYTMSPPGRSSASIWPPTVSPSFRSPGTTRPGSSPSPRGSANGRSSAPSVCGPTGGIPLSPGGTGWRWRSGPPPSPPRSPTVPGRPGFGIFGWRIPSAGPR